MKATISKNLFLNTIVCPTLGWLTRSDDQPEELSVGSLNLGQQFRMEQGANIGRRARLLFPDGVLIDRRNLTAAAEETETLMRGGGKPVLFEATFVAGDYVAKADILKKSGKSWHLIEVKSSMNLKEELLNDLAYTFMIMGQAGVRVSKASLLLVSRDYRLGMDDKHLFEEVDSTEEALERAVRMESYLDEVRGQTSAAKMPEPKLIKACKGCPVFDKCLGKGIDNHILDIPRLSPKRLEGLKDLEVFRIEDIPGTFELTGNQARVRESVITGIPWISEDLNEELGKIQWPAFYLDFESVMTAVPLYQNIAPYTQMPTQYSIHKCSEVGKVQSHRDFLCDPTKDSRRDLAEQLFSDLEHEGSIVTYSSFEKTVIKGLAELFPELSDDLTALLDRMVDLQAVIRQNLYHPGFHGSTSLKTTLPTLVPGMSYDDLEIRDGDSASAAFAYLALGKYTAGEAEKVKGNLLAYCAQDTLAMVKMHSRLRMYGSV